MARQNVVQVVFAGFVVLSLGAASCSSSTEETSTTSTTESPQLTTTSTVTTEVLPEQIGGSDETTYILSTTPIDDDDATNPIAAWESATDPNELASISISTDGKVWVAGSGGVQAWSPDASAVTSYLSQDGLPDNRVPTIATGADGSVWVGSDLGAAKRTGSDWTLHRPEDDGASCTELAVDGGGNAWCAGRDGGLYRFHGSGWHLVADIDRSVPVGVSAVGVDTDGAIWAGTEDGRVYRLEGDTMVQVDAENLTGRVTSIAFGEADTWVGTFGSGLYRFDGERWEQYTTAEGLHDDRITAVATAPDGAVWAAGGADRDALTVSRWDGTSWSNYGGPAGVEFWSQAGVVDLAVDAAGSVWASSAVGLLRLDEAWAGWEHFRVTGEGPHRNQITALAISPQQTAWAGTEVGVAIGEDGEWSVIQQHGGPGADITAITFAPDGSTWVGSANGVTRYLGDVETRYTTAEGLPSNMVTSIAVGTDGVVWVGTDAGLARLDEAGWTTPVQAPITALAPGPDGQIWVGGQGDPNLALLGSDAFTVYTVAAEIPEEGEPITDSVAAMATAPDGTLWLTVVHVGDADGAAPAGAVLSLQSGAWTTHKPSDGITGGFYGPGSIAVAPDGTVWVAAAPIEGEGGGISVFRGGEWSIDAGERLAGPIAVGPDGTAWVSISGVSRRLPGS